MAVFAAAPGRADVFDDAQLWYRAFDDRNGNDRVDAGEIRDCLHAGDATDGRNQSAKHGDGELGFAVEEVLCQYAQKTLREVSCLDLPQEDGKPTILDTGYKSRATDFTAFIRFKRGTLYSADAHCWLLNIGYGDGSGGLLIGFEPKYGCLQVFSGGRSGIIYSDHSEKTVTFGQETWIEMAVVASGTQLTVYARKNNSLDIRYDIALTKAVSPDPDKTIKIGGNTLNTHVFRGKIHQFAYWERALTSAEVLAAFSWSGEAAIDLWQAGSRVPGACPFGGASPAAVDLGDTSHWFSGAHWFDIPAFWTAGTSITTQFEVPEHFNALNQAVTMTANAGSGYVKVSVDGQEVGLCRVAVGKGSRCLIPGSRLAAGTHTLKLEQASGAFTPQFMAVAGSWQLGASYSDKGPETKTPEAYNVKTRDLKKLRYANGTKETGEKYAVAIHFELDALEAEGQYEFSFNCFGSKPKSDAVELFLNGVLVKTYSAADWSGTKTVRFGFGELRTGENVIRFVNADTSHVDTATYMGCNWYRLELRHPHRKGLFMCLR